MWSESFADYEYIAYTSGKRNLPGLQNSVAVIDESDLPQARLKDGRRGHNKLTPEIRPKVYVYEHSRFKLQPRIHYIETHFDRTRRRIHLGKNALDFALKCLARIGIGRHLYTASGPYASDVVLKHLSVHPHLR